MPAMLPNGEMVSSTTTRELLELSDGLVNASVTFYVTEVSEIKTAKNTGMPYMQVFGQNDEDEPLKLNIWGKTATAKFQGTIQPRGLYKFAGLRVSAVKPQYRYGHLPYDLHLSEWCTADLVVGDYHPRGLQLKPAEEIKPHTDWRIRCRGVVTQHFSRYMRYASSLTGPVRVRHDLVLQVTLRSVPMAFMNAFEPDTEVELVGHISRNGSVWDFDVMKWSDVRNSSTLGGNATTKMSGVGFTPPSEKTPPTPRMPEGDQFVFPSGSSNAVHYPPTPLSHRQGQSKAAITTPAFGCSDTKTTHSFVGFKESLEGMILQEPHWESLGNHFSLLVSILDDGKPRVVRVVTTQMLSDISEALKRGAKIKLTGHISHNRGGFSMDAQKVAPASVSAKPKALPTSFSDADDIHGHALMWHKIHADVISEFVGGDEEKAYSGYVLVHDSAKSIHVHLTEVPDEAVPLLCLFAELDLVGLISGDDDSLEMKVPWQHAAFHNTQKQTARPSGVKPTKATNVRQLRRSGSSTEEPSPKKHCSPDQSSHSTSSTPTKVNDVPTVDLSKVKTEDDAPLSGTAESRKRKPSTKTQSAAPRTTRALRGLDKNMPASGQNTAANVPIITIDATTAGSLTLSVDQASFDQNNIIGQLASDPVAAHDQNGKLALAPIIPADNAQPTESDVVPGKI